MTVLLGFSDGDAIPYTSRFDTLDKAYNEALSKRFLEYEGKIYITASIVKVGPV